VLLRGASVFDFGDAGAVRDGCGVGGVNDEILDFVFGIEDYGEDVSFFEAEENAEGISIARQEFGAEDRGAVVIGVAIVVLKGCEGLLESDAGYKSYAGPVVNKSAGDVGAALGRARWGMADDGLLAFEEEVSVFSLGLRQLVNPEEIFSCGEFLMVASFGGLDIPIESDQNFGSWGLGCE